MSIRLHSFADVDRSGKVRWTAAELGLEVEETRLEPGRQRAPEYLALNPFGQIPTAEIDGEVFVESSAICRVLAGRDREQRLLPPPGAARDRYEEWCAIAVETLEFPAVMCFLARAGIVDGRWLELLGETATRRFAAVVERLPAGDFLVPGRFTLADIFLAYALRVAVQGRLVAWADVSAYLEPLMARPAAATARIFASLDPAQLSDGP